MNLLLEDVNVQKLVDGRWRRHIGDWHVRAPREKLRDKYSSGATALFDWYVFHYPRHDPHRITHVDLNAADRLMNAQLGRQDARWKAAENLTRHQGLTRILRRIPASATIEDASYDELIAQAFRTLMSPGIGLAISAKLLTIKRPGLIPMLDNVVAQCFDSRDVPTLLRHFRRAVARNRATLDALAGDVEDRFGIRPSAVRVLDQLAWFDWNLIKRTANIFEVRGFAGWTFRVDDFARGVARDR